MKSLISIKGCLAMTTATAALYSGYPSVAQLYRQRFRKLPYNEYFLLIQRGNPVFNVSPL